MILWLLFLLGAEKAHAFPEMIRHGYVNCTTCHISPTGGATLNQYGRALSKEVLSTWGTENEAQFAYNLVKPPEWLNLWGAYRSVYVYRDTPTYRDGRSIFMQADLEAAAVYQKWTADFSFGYQDPANAQGFWDHAIARQFYLMYRPIEEVGIRGGKFLPAYGIRSPDHVIVTRRALRINDEGTESVNLEGSFVNETYSFFATAIFGRPDDLTLQRERGASFVASRAFGDTYKAGMSYYTGSFDAPRRQLLGPFATLGFTPHLFLLSEADLQLLPDAGSGFAAYNRLGYEIVQGLILYGTQEFARLDFTRSNSRVQTYGLGFQWFPRPHFELNATWQKMQNLSAYEDFTDYAYVMFHFYL